LKKLAVTLFSFFLCLRLFGGDPEKIHFHFAEEHLIVVKVRVNSTVDANFIIDTGAGIDLISGKLCRKIGCKKSGKYTGERMTGEKKTIDLTKVLSIELGLSKKMNQTFGVSSIFDNIPKKYGPIDGALSLNFFKNRPFSIDYKERKLILETEKSLMEIKKDGQSIILIEYSDSHTTGFHINMLIAEKHKAIFEIDTGAATTIVNSTWIERLNLPKAVKGIYPVYRIIPQIEVLNAPKIAETPANTVVRKIIYDGVLGNRFLKNWRVTFDVKLRKIIFSTP